MIDFLLRLILCPFTFHSKGNKIESHKKYSIFICKRCGNLFGVEKQKKIKKIVKE